MVKIVIDVEKHGPIFDGRAVAAARQFITAAEHEIADTGVDLVKAELGRVIRNPSSPPYYQNQVRAERSQITDGRVIYGPWLEGTGSRNKTTRFKGYFTFRRVGQRLDRQAKHIAERVLPKYLRRMQ